MKLVDDSTWWHNASATKTHTHTELLTDIVAADTGQALPHQTTSEQGVAYYELALKKQHMML